MKRTLFFILCLICFCVGIILYGINAEWIIIRPFNHAHEQHTPSMKKKVVLHYWQNEKWKSDTVEILWQQSMQENILYLVTTWLDFIHAEEIITKSILIESVIISPDGAELYLSFNRNLVPKEWPTHEKWMLIEALLKTIRAHEPSFKKVHFLVQHQPMHDAHLDFSSAWPTEGFLN